MKIGLDLDGVCYSLVAPLRELLIKKYNRDPEELLNPTRWDWFYHDWGLSYEEFNRIYRENAEFLFTYGIIKHEKKKVLEKLNEDGHEIHFISNRAAASEAEFWTKIWLENNQIEYKSLIIAEKKELYISNLDIYIDDWWENLIKMQQTKPLLETILYERPYNKDHCYNFRTISSFSDLYDFVSEISQYQ